MSFGTPSPVCQTGLVVKIVLTPPPVAEGVVPDESFHDVSGIYDSAYGDTSSVDPAQYCVACDGVAEFAVSPVKVVPPMEVAYGMLLGKSTDNPCVAGSVVSQSAAPLSPEATTIA